jgi:hypothetical protein
MEQSFEEIGCGSKLLAASLEDAHQHALRVGALLGAIAAPYSARDDHGTDGLFRAIIGRIQAGQ